MAALHFNFYMSESEMSKSIINILTIIIIFLFAIDASARTVPYSKADYEDLPVNIKADHMNYYRKEDYLNARGNVEITQGNRTLKA